jgi:hypothetical protein
MSESLTLPNGTVLHRWAHASGEEWACIATDHGPFCRLCQPVTGTLAALLENVMDARMEIVGMRPDGEFLFSLTAEGIRQVEHMLNRHDDSTGER